jgi:hypothetical protein
MLFKACFIIRSMIDPAPTSPKKFAKTTRFASWHAAITKPSIIAAWLALCATALGGCDHPALDCSGPNYAGGCVHGPVTTSRESPPVVKPAAVSPATPAPAAAVPLSSGSTSVSRGDPYDFAAVDDKQCRSYGLTFGSRDYADCRIRLSAQHRGLDPNVGAATPAPANR